MINAWSGANSYTWSVPGSNIVAPSELYTLRITSVEDPTVTATTAAFSIYETKAITQVTAPPSGGTMTLGQATDIAWTFTGGIHTVRLALKRGGSIIRDIVPSTPCDGAHSWMTATDGTGPTPGSGYTVEVSDVASNVAAESGAFTIEPVRSLVVTSVTSVSNPIVEGQTVHVKWTTTNNIPSRS